MSRTKVCWTPSILPTQLTYFLCQIRRISRLLVLKGLVCRYALDDIVASGDALIVATCALELFLDLRLVLVVNVCMYFGVLHKSPLTSHLFSEVEFSDGNGDKEGSSCSSCWVHCNH